MKASNRVTGAAVLLSLSAFGPLAISQVQTPPNSVPIGESRLPTERVAQPVGASTGGDDCNRRVDAIRDQFRIQQGNVRREIADRVKLASDGEKERIRQEGEQRLATLKLEAADAERRVMASCRG
jgi:hypothetical protein